MSEKIHFLNTGYSDCIILESNGLIAMIDAAEDSDIPENKPYLKYPGYEDVVVNYLLSHFADENGKVRIEFVLGTHAHSDHLGGFDTVINHPDIEVKTAYLKPYDSKQVFIYERLIWDNEEVYRQMLNAIKENGVELIESFDNTQTILGNISIKFYNGEYRKHFFKYGENVNSVVTLAEVYGKRFVFAGDLNYKCGDEKRLAKEIGKVDILKVGHHGYFFSTSVNWVKKLCPEYAIVCNSNRRIYPDVKWKLKNISHSIIIATADVNGVIVEVDKNSGISIKPNSMEN